MERLLYELIAASFAAVMIFVVIRMAKARLGEKEVSRRMQQGSRAQAIAGLGFVVAMGIGAALGAAFGQADVGAVVGFALGAVGGVAYGVRHDRAARRDRG